MRRGVTTWDRGSNRESISLLYNEPGVEVRKSLWFSDFDVFISHKGEDLEIAEKTGELLSSRGVSGYLDRWDPSVDGDSDELEIYLRNVIRDTPYILAVVTQKTSMSWWVPFEIGVARETDSWVATYVAIDNLPPRNKIYLPSYLRIWPILVTDTELTNWADAVTSSRRESLSFGAGYIEKSTERPGIDILEEYGIVEFL